MRLIYLIAAATVLCSALPAQAQTQSDKLIPISILAADSVARLAADSTVPALPVASPAIAKADTGGKTLTMLQAGMIALQTMDLVSTHQALSRPGTYEANPAFGIASGSLPASIALKAGATAGIILLTNRVAKTNRAAAIATMVALNSVYATIAARNFAIAHGR